LENFYAQHHWDPQRLLPFFSMVDLRKNLHKEIVENPPATDVQFLHTLIPYASEIEAMGSYRTAVSVYAAGSRSAKAYSDLWQEIKTRIGFL
jgi:chromosome partitioning protein